MLWINSHQSSRAADWTSVLATHLIDHSVHLEYLTRLRCFCHGHSPGNAVSTAAIVVQALIFQSLLHHRKRFTMRSVKYTQRRFQEAEDDVEALWALFLEILATAKAKCLWIIIDHVNMLQRESGPRGLEDALTLLKLLNQLAEAPNMVVKILVTARVGGPADFSTEIADTSILSPHHSVINVTRGTYVS